ncbi:MAG TPA: hypothetical protein VL133_13490 [Devosia sp.]|nr:hypothetical protein [Devosia sp.]
MLSNHGSKFDQHRSQSVHHAPTGAATIDRAHSEAKAEAEAARDSVLGTLMEIAEEFPSKRAKIDASAKGYWQGSGRMADAVLEAIGLKSCRRRRAGIYHCASLPSVEALGARPVEIKTLHGVTDEGIVTFLVSRGLAKSIGGKLVITSGGKDIDEIEDER